MDQKPRYLEQPPDWTADEQPVLPGSPPSIEHSTPKRYLYLIIGTFIAISASLSNGFITANLPQIQGQYGLTPVEAAYLPAAYVMANITANLILFKARQQYGLRLFSELGLLAFISVMTLHLFVDTYRSALVVRFFSGFVAAPMTSLGMYYIMQGSGASLLSRIKGFYVGIGFTQLGVPLAWVISPLLVSVNNWTVLYSFELGLAICCFAMVVSLKLPRSARVAVFEKQDILTFALIAPGFACLCAVLVQGPLRWWFDSNLLAYILIIGFSLVVLGFFYEHQRSNPLIRTRWLGTASTLRFIIAAFAIRVLMSEQTYAEVNFLKTMGMGPDQFVPLYLIIFIAMFSGVIFSALTFSLKWMTPQLLFAVLLILIACYLDSNLTSDVRPQNFYLSQSLVAFAGGLFIGPLLLRGLLPALQQGAGHIVTYLVLFSATQSFGGLVGSSFFSTYQKERTQVYQTTINNGLNATDSTVEQRLALYQAKFSPNISDPAKLQVQATASMAQVTTREAQVRAFNDVIYLNGVFALTLLIWGLSNLIWARYVQNRQPPSPSPSS